MILASFQFENSLAKAWFLQETFLLANTSVMVNLEILFLAFNKVDANFAKRELI